MARIQPRDDVALMDGYHSPQVDVEVRLNTNESPIPPPDAWLAALADEVRAHRVAPLSRSGAPASCASGSAPCTASAPSRCSPRTGRTRSCRRCVSPTAATVGRSRCSSRRTRCTATSPGSTGTERRDRRADGRLRARSRRGAARPRPPSARHHVPVLAEQPDRPRRERGDGSRGAARGSGPRRGRRGVRPVRAVVGARARRRGHASRRHPDLLQDVVDGRGPARLPRRADLGDRRSREGRAAVSPRLAQAGRRAARPRVHRAHGGPGRRGGRGTGSAGRRA